jgi:hypothetical protein
VNNNINHGKNSFTDTCKSSEVTGETTSATNTGECTIRPTTQPEKMAKGGYSTVVLVDIITTKTTEDPVEQFQKLFGLVCNLPKIWFEKSNANRVSYFEKYAESVLAAFNANPVHFQSESKDGHFIVSTPHSIMSHYCSLDTQYHNQLQDVRWEILLSGHL